MKKSLGIVFLLAGDPAARRFLALTATRVFVSGRRFSVDVPRVNTYRPPGASGLRSAAPFPATAYVWTPGYWALERRRPRTITGCRGTWVPAPQPEYLWTPGYWGSEGVVFSMASRLLGVRTSAFYGGGVNYGYGYGGQRLRGRLTGRAAACTNNRSVNNINNVKRDPIVYNKTVINKRHGQPGQLQTAATGIHAQPHNPSK